jgi:hypothetical protein
MINKFLASRGLLKRCVGLVISLLVLAACEPADRPTRGPQSAPVERVAMGRFDLASSERAELSAVDFQAALQALAGQQIPGLEMALLKAQPSDTSFDLLLVTLALEDYEPSLIEPAAGTNELRGFDLLLGRAATGTAEYSVLLGSFFVADFAPLEPLGLLQISGRELGPVQPHGYTRILGVSRNGLGVVHRGAFHRGLFASAVQVGPGIVEAGKLDINETERRLPTYLRSFVGACGDRALLGVSFARLHLYDVGQRLQAWLQEQNLVCDEVANLSGDRETLLVLPEAGGSSLLVYGDLQAPKTALLVFQP